MSERLRANFDHIDFPGAVPRTFLGAVVLSGLSRPLLSITGDKHAQFIARLVLGMFNTFALLKYRTDVQKAFGRNAARWLVLLLSGQFHIIFYSTRTLPNMFAFGLSRRVRTLVAVLTLIHTATLAFSCLLPVNTAETESIHKRHKLSIYYFVLAGVIFRSEIALLLLTHLLYLLATSRTTLTFQSIVTMGASAAGVALFISVPLDSYLWQQPVWPELSGFIFNAIQGKSAEWGTSPIYVYFTNFLPKLLLNPMILLVGIPLSLYIPSSRRSAAGLVVPNLAFVAIYSFQPHKEARFIIYVVPPLTAAASVAAAYITRHRRSLLHRLLHMLFVISIPLSMVASASMLFVSSLNYPGGEALYALHEHLHRKPTTQPIRVHLDVLSCMTGITRFQQDYPSPPFYTAATKLILNKHKKNVVNLLNFRSNLVTIYDKSENETDRVNPEFWAKFDYLITSSPETAVGKWAIVETIYGYAGIEILRPSQNPRENSPIHSWQYTTLADEHVVFAENNTEKTGVQTHNAAGFSEEYKAKIKELGIYGCVRQAGRLITGGWWIGPRMEAKIWVLERTG